MRNRRHPLPGCAVKACHQQATSCMPNALCERHRRQKYRTGRTETIWAEKQGPECGICGRSVYEHGVTEWCHVETRMAQNA